MKFQSRKADRKAKRQDKKQKKNKFYKNVEEEVEEIVKKPKVEKTKVKEKKKPKSIEDPVFLDTEIEELEKKLGIRSKGSKEVEKNQKKLRKQLELDGFGADFYDILEGKVHHSEDEISVEGLKPGEESPEITLVSQGEEEDFSEEEQEDFTDENSEEEIDNEIESDEDQLTKKRKLDTEKTEAKYVPPALRAIDASKKLKGLLNRISDQNIEPITTQIVELFKTESMNVLNDNLWDFLVTSTNSMEIPPQLLAVFAVEVAALGKVIGREIPAFILDKLFHALSENSKSYISVWCYLYYFDSFGANMMIGLINYLSDKLTEATLELLIIIFNLVGFKIRKDEPGVLKNIIEKIREKGKILKTDNKRMVFMLETLTNIKNNKKMINQTEDRLKFLKTWIKKTIGKKPGAKDAKITANFEDLGGSNWRSLLQPSFDYVQKESNIDPELESLAQSQHMSTGSRKQIFSLIMSSEDYMDAYAKLIKLKKQERDIVRVIITSCGQELAYNHFYSLLASQLCCYKSSYKYSFQYALWDNLKQMHEYSVRKICNISKLYAFMITSESMGLSCIKALNFDSMNENLSMFLRVLLETVLLAEENILAKVFNKVGSSEKLKPLAEGLRVFMKVVILNHPRKGFIEKLGNEQILKEKVRVTRDLLKASY